MLERKLTGPQFTELAREALMEGTALSFHARGNSMRPFIRYGDRLVISGITFEEIRLGDIIVFSQADSRLLVHRVIKVAKSTPKRKLLLQGDALLSADGWVAESEILGKVIALQRGKFPPGDNGWRILDKPDIHLYSLLVVYCFPVFKILYRLIRRPWLLVKRSLASEEMV